LTDDYDRLTELGKLQARLLGEHWKRQGKKLDALFTGPRLRQRQTAEIAAEALGHVGAVVVLEELDEYQADAVLEKRLSEISGRDESKRLAEELGSSDLLARGRALDKLLRLALSDWAKRELPGEVESFVAFGDRIARALAKMLEGQGEKRKLAAVSSAGSIGALVGRVLGVSPDVMLELGFVVNNASETEIFSSSGRVGLLRFNGLQHLSDPAHFTRR
jgi:broad specificity phosphatase PhoE